MYGRRRKEGRKEEGIISSFPAQTAPAQSYEDGGYHSLSGVNNIYEEGHQAEGIISRMTVRSCICRDILKPAQLNLHPAKQRKLHRAPSTSSRQLCSFPHDGNGDNGAKEAFFLHQRRKAHHMNFHRVHACGYVAPANLTPTPPLTHRYVYSLDVNSNNALGHVSRPFSSSAPPSSSSPPPCPFRALSIPKSSTYAAAKKSFLKIAMKNHPDTLLQHLSKDDPSYQQTLEKCTDKFRKARLAFESLVQDEDTGLCRLKVEVEAEEEMTMSNEQFEYVHAVHSVTVYQYPIYSVPCCAFASCVS